DATYELWLGGIPFRIRVAGGRFEAARGEADAPDAVIRSDPNTVARVVFGENRLGKAVEAGDVRIDGSRKAVNALLRALSSGPVHAAAPDPSFRASTALTVFLSAPPRTRLPKTVSTAPSARPLRVLPSRTTTTSSSVVPSGCGVNV